MATVVGICGCGHGSTGKSGGGAYALNSPPPERPAVIPPSMQEDGALDTSCTLTYTGGVATGATIKLYSPARDGVEVSQIGIELISNVVLISTQTIQTADFPGPKPSLITLISCVFGICGAPA